FVVPVRDGSHIRDMLGPVTVAQQPVEHVKDDQWTGIADMGEVVDRGTAHIKAYARGIERGEVPLLSRQCVVKPQLHARILLCFVALPHWWNARQAGNAR